MPIFSQAAHDLKTTQSWKGKPYFIIIFLDVIDLEMPRCYNSDNVCTSSHIESD
jgi:hypothetical protein